MSAARPRTRTRRAARAGVGAAVVAAAVLGLAPFAGAVDLPTFSDVPSGHPFEDEITQLIALGVTEGYPDGTFRPTQPVSRQSMAAFLQRFREAEPQVAWASTTTPFSRDADTYAPVPGLSATITTADIPAGGLQPVLHVTLTAEHGCRTGIGCRLGFRVDGQPAGPQVTLDADDDEDSGEGGREAHLVQFSTPVDPGTHTVTVEIVSTDMATATIDDASLVVRAELQPAS